MIIKLRKVFRKLIIFKMRGKYKSIENSKLLKPNRYLLRIISYLIKCKIASRSMIIYRRMKTFT